MDESVQVVVVDSIITTHLGATPDLAVLGRTGGSCKRRLAATFNFAPCTLKLPAQASLSLHSGTLLLAFAENRPTSFVTGAQVVVRYPPNQIATLYNTRHAATSYPPLQ